MKLNLKTIVHLFRRGLDTGMFKPPVPVRAVTVVAVKERQCREYNEVLGKITNQDFINMPRKTLKAKIRGMARQVWDADIKSVHMNVQTFGDAHSARIDIRNWLDKQS